MKKNKSENLFDGNFTFLDAVKILMLVVTLFSTYNIVDLMTPDVAFRSVRLWAAVGVVEGAFLGFEYATINSKSWRQVRFATIGFFLSLVVIVVFAGASGILEFGGETLLEQSAGVHFGMALTVRDAAMIASLFTLVTWIALLATIYRLYALADPDQKAELALIALGESVTEESNHAMEIAIQQAKPVIGSARALADIRSRFENELSKGDLDILLQDVATVLRDNYSVHASPAVPPAPAPIRSSFGDLIADGVSKVRSLVGKRDENAPIPADPNMPFLEKKESTVPSPLPDAGETPE